MSENEKEYKLRKLVAWFLAIFTVLLIVAFCFIYGYFTNSCQSSIYLEKKYKYFQDIVYPSWTYIKNDTLYVSKVLSSEDKEVLYYTEKIVAEEWKEDELIPITAHEGLIESIDYLLERGYQDERDGNS